jgi:hypothetical protein
VSQNNIVPSALADLITVIMKIGRKCPAVQGDILELMLLVSRIQACMAIDPGYVHAKRIIARLRHPLWDDLTPEEREVLRQAAEAIKRACKLNDADIPEDGSRSRRSVRFLRATSFRAGSRRRWARSFRRRSLPALRRRFRCCCDRSSLGLPLAALPPLRDGRCAASFTAMTRLS